MNSYVSNALSSPIFDQFVSHRVQNFLKTILFCGTIQFEEVAIFVQAALSSASQTVNKINQSPLLADFQFDDKYCKFSILKKYFSKIRKVSGEMKVGDGYLGFFLERAVQHCLKNLIFDGFSFETTKKMSLSLHWSRGGRNFPKLVKFTVCFLLGILRVRRNRFSLIPQAFQN